MAIVRYGPVRESEISDGVRRAAEALAPDVVRIRHDLGEDWTGDAAIFFKVLLSDEAVPNREAVFPLTEKIREAILAEVNPYDQGLLPYFSFRTISEQADLKDPAWN